MDQDITGTVRVVSAPARLIPPAHISTAALRDITGMALAVLQAVMKAAVGPIQLPEPNPGVRRLQVVVALIPIGIMVPVPAEAQILTLEEEARLIHSDAPRHLEAVDQAGLTAIHARVGKPHRKVATMSLPPVVAAGFTGTPEIAPAVQIPEARLPLIIPPQVLVLQDLTG